MLFLTFLRGSLPIWCIIFNHAHFALTYEEGSDDSKPSGPQLLRALHSLSKHHHLDCIGMLIKSSIVVSLQSTRDWYKSKDHECLIGLAAGGDDHIFHDHDIFSITEVARHWAWQLFSKKTSGLKWNKSYLFILSNLLLCTSVVLFTSCTFVHSFALMQNKMQP